MVKKADKSRSQKLGKRKQESKYLPKILGDQILENMLKMPPETHKEMQGKKKNG